MKLGAATTPATIRLEIPLLLAIDAHADRLGASRAGLIREILLSWLVLNTPAAIGAPTEQGVTS